MYFGSDEREFGGGAGGEDKESWGLRREGECEGFAKTTGADACDDN